MAFAETDSRRREVSAAGARTNPRQLQNLSLLSLLGGSEFWRLGEYLKKPPKLPVSKQRKQSMLVCYLKGFYNWLICLTPKTSGCFCGDGERTGKSPQSPSTIGNPPRPALRDRPGPPLYRLVRKTVMPGRYPQPASSPAPSSQLPRTRSPPSSAYRAPCQIPDVLSPTSRHHSRNSRFEKGAKQ